ncbi:MAG TPA: hypothetical protein PKN62_01735 [bacterium]|nr:hypothetical protein [bacterium]
MFGKTTLETVMDFAKEWQSQLPIKFAEKSSEKISPGQFFRIFLPQIIEWYEKRSLFIRLEAKDGLTHLIRQMCFVLASSNKLKSNEITTSLLAVFASDVGKGLLEPYQQIIHPEMSGLILDSCLRSLEIEKPAFLEAVYATMAHNGYEERIIVGEIDHPINSYSDKIEGRLHLPTVMARKAAQAELMGPYGFARIMLANYRYPERFNLENTVDNSVFIQINNQIASQSKDTIYSQRDFGTVKELNDQYCEWLESLSILVQSTYDQGVVKDDSVDAELSAWLHEKIGSDFSVDNFIDMLNNLDEANRTAWLAGLHLAQELAKKQADLLTEKIGKKLRIIPDDLPVFGSIFHEFLN